MKLNRTRIGVLAAVLLGASALAGSALAAAPNNSTSPTITGTARAGSTLTASNGTWSNTPTSFAYQWQRCATDGTDCGDITGATSKTYTLVSNDVLHTIRVTVTASNTDGKASARSGATDVVDSKNGPSNTVRPSVSGTAQVGEELTVSHGSWSTTPTSFSYRWQRCDTDGTGCLNVVGATGRTYGVRSADVGNKMRALVTAHTANGVATAPSSLSDVVSSNNTTTTVTSTVQGNKAPTIRFISLKRIGARVYARFRVCDDTVGRTTVIERDQKARVLPYRRTFAVTRTFACGTFARHWKPAARFRTRGRMVVSLRAEDKSRALSRIVSRSLYRRF
jgi:hypothetical protein